MSRIRHKRTRKAVAVAADVGSLVASGEHKTPLHGEGAAPRRRADRASRRVPADGMASGGGKWIQGAIKRPGALHRALHVAEGEKIPAKKLQRASHSENPRIRKMVGLAKTLKGLHH